MNNLKIILAFTVCLILGAVLFVVAQRNPKSEIPKNLVQKLIADINDNENNFRLSDDDLKVLHKNLKFELHDLDGDGVAEFFLYIEHRD